MIEEYRVVLCCKPYWKLFGMYEDYIPEKEILVKTADVIHWDATGEIRDPEMLYLRQKGYVFQPMKHSIFTKLSTKMKGAIS